MKALSLTARARRTPTWRSTFTATLVVCAISARAQDPSISTLVPVGGRAGTTVTVELRGGNLNGASRLLISGTGITSTVGKGAAAESSPDKPVWQAKCSGCHELRSPANRSMTADQWRATVRRMVQQHNAPISKPDEDKIDSFIVSQVSNGKVTAQLTIAPDAQPGLHEVMALTPAGISTTALFEVGRLPEVSSRLTPTVKDALAVPLPCVANGCLERNAQRDYYRFQGAAGTRLVFNLKGFRYNPLIQGYFNPQLRLLSDSGQVLAENHGYFDLDPLIDWRCPAEGSYIIEVSDILGRGNPGSAYRLTMGTLPYNTTLFPPVCAPGKRLEAQVFGTNSSNAACSIAAPWQQGLQWVSTPQGPLRLLVSQLPAVRSGSAVTELPACLVGNFSTAGTVDTFALQGSGDYDVQVHSKDLGSEAEPQIVLLRAGKLAGRYNGERNWRIHLDAKQPYTMQVQNGASTSGPEFTYALEVGTSYPNLQCVFRPSNVTVRPGMRTPIEIHFDRRDGINSPVEVAVQGLPEGVHAEPCIIPQDQGVGYLLLTADDNAKLAAHTFTVTASAQTDHGTIQVPVQAQETDKVQNDDYFINRDQAVAAVCGAAQFTLAPAFTGNLKLTPGESMRLGVNVQRQPVFGSGIVVRVGGLPAGWICNAEYVGTDRKHVDLIVYPGGGDPQRFVKRDATWPQMNAQLIGEADGFSYVFATLPLVASAAK